MKIQAAILAICLLISSTGCAGDKNESSEQASSPSSAAPISSSLEHSTSNPENYDSVLAQYSDDEIVRDNALANPLENTDLLEAWMEDYRQGKPAKVAILSDGMGFPPALYILESDGSPTYSINCYNKKSGDNSSEPSSPQIYQSSLVIGRVYDYVFGADFPANIQRNVIVVHRRKSPMVKEMSWNPAADRPFDGISFEQAEQIAKDNERQLMRHMSVIPNIYGGGVYLRDSILQKAGEYSGPEIFYNVTKAVQIDDQSCYVIYANADKAALERGEHGGSVTAVSADGNLVFIQSMVDGSWIFVADKKEQKIAPGLEASSEQASSETSSSQAPTLAPTAPQCDGGSIENVSYDFSAGLRYTVIPATQLAYHSGYRLEFLENGKWQEVNSTNDVHEEPVKRIVDSNMDVIPPTLLDRLSPGKYRAVKTFYGDYSACYNGYFYFTSDGSGTITGPFSGTMEPVVQEFAMSSITDVSYSASTQTVTYTLNPAVPMTYGVDYTIEKNIDAGWEKTDATDDMMFILILMLADKPKQESITLTEALNKLEDGTYRIVKRYTDEAGDDYIGYITFIYHNGDVSFKGQGTVQPD